MKIARFVLKIVAASLAVAALACAIVAYWDKIMELFCCAKSKGTAKAKSCGCNYPSEYDDYADWEMME